MPQKKTTSDAGMPGKLTAGGWALAAAVRGTTLYDGISEHQMGILIKPESVNALHQGLVKALSPVYQANARIYAENHLNKVV
jgi:colanic acid biosynthesis glycosyl transferase WcaI